MAVYLIQNNSSTTTSLQDGINTVIVNSNTTIITFGGTYSLPTTHVAKIVNNTWEFSVTVASGVYPPVLVCSNLTYISHKNASYEITNPIATLSVYKESDNGTAIWSWACSGCYVASESDFWGIIHTRKRDSIWRLAGWSELLRKYLT